MHASKNGFYPGKYTHFYKIEDSEEKIPHERVGHSYQPLTAFYRKSDSLSDLEPEWHDTADHLHDITQLNVDHWETHGSDEHAAKTVSYYADVDAGTHREMNNVLRREHGSYKDHEQDKFIHKDPEHEVRSKINDLSDLIKSAPHRPEYDFHVYTGLGHRSDMHEITKNHGGKAIAVHFPGFVSTSLNHETAMGFASPKPNKDEDIKLGPDYEVSDLVKIHVPSGHKRGLYIGNASLNPAVGDGEHEYLLDKGHILHVHPEPEYHVNSNRTITRLWHAHVKHDGN